MNKIETNQQTPDLSSANVAKILFNDPSFSDVLFVCNDYRIYAHSWILMNRSSVFQKQMESTMDVKKCIPIVNAAYEVFFQFIRFLYTDECNVTTENKIELLKLAIHYKVIMLEMKLVNIKSIAIDQHLMLFEYCIVHKYEMAFRFTCDLIKFYLSAVLKCNHFVTIHPDVMEEILKFENIRDDVREVDLFNALVRWMNYTSERYEIPIDKRHTHFDKFLRLIRFSSMTSDEIRVCLETNPDVISKEDIAVISIFGDGSEGRSEYVRSCGSRRLLSHWRRKTIFTLSSELILYGLRYGIKFNESALQIRITARNLTTNVVEKEDLWFEPSTEILILGDDFVLKPNFEYTIDVKYEKEDKEFKIFTRRLGENAIVNGPQDLVQMTEASANLIEIFFKPLTN